MTDNLYAPPQADLTKPSIKGEPYKHGFDRAMVIAVILLVIISLLISVFDFMYEDSGKESLANAIVGFLINISLVIFVVYLIKRLRVRGLGTNAESAAKALGVWGYVWRGLITQTISVVVLVIPLILVVAFSGLNLDRFYSSLAGVVLINIVLFPISLFCVWLVFSKDRSGQLSGFLKVFRGY